MVMQEIVAVAQAQHIALPADVIPRTLAELAQFPPGGTNSMQRPSENERVIDGKLRLSASWGATNLRLWHLSWHPMICCYNVLEMCATSRAAINGPANRLR